MSALAPLLALACAAALVPPAAAQGADGATEDATLYLDGVSSSGLGGGQMDREAPRGSEPERVEPVYEVSLSRAVWKAENGVNFTLRTPVKIELWVEHLDELLHVGDPTDPSTAGLPTFNFTLATGEGDQGWRVVTLPDRTPGAGPVRLTAEIPPIQGARVVADGSVNLVVVHYGRPILATDPNTPLRYLVNSTEFPSSVTFPGVPSDAFRYGPKEAREVRDPAPGPATGPNLTGPQDPRNRTSGAPGGSDSLEKTAALVALAVVASLSGWAASRLFRPKKL